MILRPMRFWAAIPGGEDSVSVIHDRWISCVELTCKDETDQTDDKFWDPYQGNDNCGVVEVR